MGVGCVVLGLGVWRYLGLSDAALCPRAFLLTIPKSPAEVFGETKANITMKPFTFKPPCKITLIVGSLLNILLMGVTACSTAGQLNVSAVTYQSINTKKPQQTQENSIPKNAKILVSYLIDKWGQIGVIITNLTDEILIIDQEKSFLINTDGISQSYYDPNTYTSTTTTHSFNSSGTSINLGGIASALGVGGRIGSLLGGITTSNSSTQGISTSNSIIVTDQKTVKIGPHGTIALSKTFPIKGIGIKNVSSSISADMTYTDSPLKFSSCISYSLDNNKVFNKIITDFYVSSSIYAPVRQKGKVNEALREIISTKTDLLSQPWYMFHFINNIKAEAINLNFWKDENYLENVKFDNIVQGMIYSYQ